MPPRRSPTPRCREPPAALWEKRWPSRKRLPKRKPHMTPPPKSIPPRRERITRMKPSSCTKQRQNLPPPWRRRTRQLPPTQTNRSPTTSRDRPWSKMRLWIKARKIVAPPGCIEAYEKYLELAPDGPLAPEVKQVLEGMGQTDQEQLQSQEVSPPCRTPVEISRARERPSTCLSAVSLPHLQCL